jgi:hypothetical protein
MSVIECGPVPLALPYEAGCFSDLCWFLDVTTLDMNYPRWVMFYGWGSEPAGYYPPVSGFEVWRTPAEIEAAVLAQLGFGPDDDIPF